MARMSACPIDHRPNVRFQFTSRGDYRCWEGPEYEKWLASLRAEIEEDRDLLGLAGDGPAKLHNS